MIQILKKTINLLTKEFILFHYLYYRLIDQEIKLKMQNILKYNEKDIDLLVKDDQEEQALPGMNKYRKNNWYKYMFARYLFSIKYIRDKITLDSGCGLGWGSYLISKFTKKLLSIDINENVIQFAKEHWKSPNLSYRNHSILNLVDLKDTFDVVLGYEVIEHLQFKLGLRYIKQISEVLKSGGVVILSSAFPDNKLKAEKLEQKNKYHYHIYTMQEIRSILKKNKFHKIIFYGNSILKATKK